MNNPFDYIPSAEMLQAQQTLINHIESLRIAYPEFREEVDKGKMFGILFAKEEILYAFSGQIANRYDWDGFVPPVYDYLDPDGYFKTHEAEITNINNKVYELEHSAELAHLINAHRDLNKEAKDDIEAYKLKMQAAKTERDLLRQSGYAGDPALIKESQFMKAELHRRKLHWRSLLEQSMEKIEAYESEIRHLKLQRQHKSDALQRWLFQQFVFTNSKGEKRSLMELSYPMNLPPSGSGECCEPKLLNYAFTHGLTPLEIGMFWWGESPRQEIRHHLQFYPACNGKCKPILEFFNKNLLKNISNKNFQNSQNFLSQSVLPSKTYSVNSVNYFPLVSGCEAQISCKIKGSENENLCNYLPLVSGYKAQISLIRLETVFEDESIIVVNKPAGLLSVPGKNDAPSVFSILKAKHPELPELQMVHRLDMDTSGLLVVAKTKQAHKHLQQQFAEHSIYKEYVAVLEEKGESRVERGEIRLPLRPDYEDRPRQLVDHEHGHVALTRYEFIDDTKIKLIPETGRTHQLRVHCAHKEGLCRPIKGDRLYGKRSDRLYLHAATLEFTHPQTGERLSFHVDPEFKTL